MNVDTLASCIEEREFAVAVDDAYNTAGETLGLRGTPSVFINGYRVANFGDLQSYRDLIAMLEAFGEE